MTNDLSPVVGPPLRLHASCGARGDSAVLLLGKSGAGKTDLLLRLIDRGFILVADDIVMVEDGGAAPPDALAGLIEVRGLGLLRMAHVAPVPLMLAVSLDGPQPRLPLPERYRPDRALGRGGKLDLPMLRIDPFTASAALRIELALDCLENRRELHVGAFSGHVAEP